MNNLARTINSFMASHTQRSVVAEVSFVLSAYIRPLKVTFHSLRNFLEPAIFTMSSFTLMSNDPMMQCSVGYVLSLPKIVIRSSSKFVRASTRTTLLSLGLVIRKFFSTSQTLLTWGGATQKTCALSRATSRFGAPVGKSATQLPGFCKIFNTAIATVGFNHKLILTQ
jgi:hypothetical protein